MISKQIKQIKRITRYETLMNKAEQLIKKYSKDDADELCEIMKELESYYLSDEWKQDFSDDEAGLLPPDLKRGVLSEDGIYNLIETYRELYEKYVELKHASVNAVQGEWIEKYNGNGWNDFWDYTCSNCGKKYERADAVLYHANFCPNCGADMRKKEDE